MRSSPRRSRPGRDRPGPRRRSNVAEYAEADTVCVDVAQTDGALVVTITDDGVGGAAPAEGSRLRGLADRVNA